MFRSLRYDIPSGLAVFLVAIPLCLGIAVASNMPLISGIIAGVVGGLVVGIISKSPLSVSGPAAGLVAIVVSALQKVGIEAFLFAMVLAGLLQILMGIFKASKIAKYIPVTVIKGMLAAIGMTLIIKQLPTMLGVQGAMFHLDSMSILINGCIIGLVSLLIMIGWKQWGAKRFPLIPGSLIAVLAGIAISIAYNYFMPEWSLVGNQLVNLPSNITSLGAFWSNLSHPNLSAWQNPQIYIVAITIALVASIESILCIQAIDKLDPKERTTPLNRELIAQGAGNIVSGLLGGLPVTSVIVRSSVNLHANAQSKLSTITHAILLCIAVLFAATYINMIPMAVLAAVLVHTGYQLTNPEKFISKYKAGMREFIPFVATFAIILAEDLLVGVLAGIAIYYIMVALEKKWFPRKQLLEQEVD